MNELCWLDIGPPFEIGSKQVRHFIKKYDTRLKKMGIDIGYNRISWYDILCGEKRYEKFLEKNGGKTILARYRYPEEAFDILSQQKTSQNKYLPGNRYIKFFGENVKWIEEKLIKDLDIKFVNPAKSVADARDKYKMLQKFRENEIAVPDTFLIDNADDLEKLLETYGSLFLKPPGGSFGRGATLVRKVGGSKDEKPSDTYMIETKYRLGNKLQPCNETKIFHSNDKTKFIKKISQILKISSLVQPNIKTPPLLDRYDTELKWDMRIVIVFPQFYQKIVSATIRAVPSEEIVTNLSAGGTAHNLEKIFRKDSDLKRDFDLGVGGFERLRNISIRASEISGLNEVGVDLMLSKDDLVPYIIEVNALPEYRAGYYSGINIGEFVVCGMLQHAGFEDPFPGLGRSTFEDENSIARMFKEYRVLQSTT